MTIWQRRCLCTLLKGFHPLRIPFARSFLSPSGRRCARVELWCCLSGARRVTDAPRSAGVTPRRGRGATPAQPADQRLRLWTLLKGFHPLRIPFARSFLSPSGCGCSRVVLWCCLSGARRVADAPRNAGVTPRRRRGATHNLTYPK